MKYCAVQLHPVLPRSAQDMSCSFVQLLSRHIQDVLDSHLVIVLRLSVTYDSAYNQVPLVLLSTGSEVLE